MSVERAINNMNAADHTFRAALRQHRLAPPDAGFPRRLKDFADACESQQIACDYAAQEGLGWEPMPAARRPPPPELRPDSGRRGPTELWATFDTGWEDLNKALEGISLPAVARAFGELATVLRQLATAVAEEDARVRPRPARLTGPHVHTCRGPGDRSPTTRLPERQEQSTGVCGALMRCPGDRRPCDHEPPNRPASRLDERAGAASPRPPSPPPLPFRGTPGASTRDTSRPPGQTPPRRLPAPPSRSR